MRTALPRRSRTPLRNGPTGDDSGRDSSGRGYILDALEIYEGPVWASHHNCRALVDDPRQLSDRQIIALAERNAVIGVALDVWMVVPEWKRGISKPCETSDANLNGLANHVDHMCQLLSTNAHTGIGTDLDGGFGTEQTPADLDTIADLNHFKNIAGQRIR